MERQKLVEKEAESEKKKAVIGQWADNHSILYFVAEIKYNLPVGSFLLLVSMLINK